MDNIPVIDDYLSCNTYIFYAKVSSYPNHLISSLAQYDRSSLTFRVKHKLPKVYAIKMIPVN